GAMESNQRHISYRMKRRGMHWSDSGAEAMVKIKQGILNDTLREVYLASQHRSDRKQRKVKQTVRMSALLSQKTKPFISAKKGSIPVHAAHSSAIGQLFKTISKPEITGIFGKVSGFGTLPNIPETKRSAVAGKSVQN